MIVPATGDFRLNTEADTAIADLLATLTTSNAP
jgi:hypothetical protein